VNPSTDDRGAHAAAAPGEAGGPRAAGGRATALLRFLMRDAGVALALALIVLFFSLTAPYFASTENVLKIFVQIAINTVLAAGMTFVILTGGIDLSVGSVLALCSVVGALIMTHPDLPVALSVPLALLGCMGTGAACGWINGFIIEQWKIPPFIVTLGMLNMASGAARVVSNNSTITGLPQPFVDFGNAIVFGVFPTIFLIALLVVGASWFVLRFTVFGRFVFAIGTNEEAVRLSGHAPRKYKIAVYTICGLTAGTAAMVYLLRLNVGSPIAGIGYELNAIAAVIIGGTSLSGGKGSIVGTLVGACILQVLSTGLQLFGVGDNFKPIVIGAVIILAVIVDAYRERFLGNLESRA
jgi:ribose transport system permease protein